MQSAALRPDWDQLFRVASEQDGLFTTQQAADAGYSSQLLAHHLQAGKVIRVQRGIYRLVHFPLGDHEDLVAAWLWSEREGVVSHLTALALQRLSDALPAQIHLTVPEAWKQRRFRVPERVVLHHADITSSERAWFGAVPITQPLRTLHDCARDHVSPELMRQALQQAVQRGLVTRDELKALPPGLATRGGRRK